MSTPSLPDYDDLPRRAGLPSAWEVWRPIREDRFGCLNLLTPERAAAAAQSVERGAVFPLNWTMGLPDPPLRFYGDPDAALDDVRVLGGVAFAAHPHSPRVDFRWRRWDLPGAWGLELLNGDSQWRAAGAWRLFRTLTGYAVNREAALIDSLSDPAATLAQWDRLLASRPTPVLAGAATSVKPPSGSGSCA